MDGHRVNLSQAHSISDYSKLMACTSITLYKTICDSPLRYICKLFSIQDSWQYNFPVYHFFAPHSKYKKGRFDIWTNSHEMARKLINVFGMEEGIRIRALLYSYNIVLVEFLKFTNDVSKCSIKLMGYQVRVICIKI